MKAVAVFVKNNGILLPCRVFPAPDGCVWQCAACEHAPLLRASFGVMSGFWRCPCGAEVELFVDGHAVKIEELNELEAPAMFGGPEAANVAAAGSREVNDEDFLRECGIRIAADATEEEPC